jgi:hypothetical protein
MSASETVGVVHTAGDDQGDDQSDNQVVRPATDGDVGTITGWCHAGPSGLGLLLIQLGSGERIYLPGDWRCIRDMAEELAGRKVLVEAGDFSGGWIVSPLDLDDRCDEQLGAIEAIELIASREQ